VRAVDQISSRQVLEKKLDQTRRIAATVYDPTTTQRLKNLIEDLGRRLRETE
jgi:hypothetical protein